MLIDIILSTYNGTRYLTEQLESVLKQTYQNWHLIVRDDGSTDDTVEIAKRYAAQFPGRITYIDDRENLGACRSFAKLLSETKASYVMFCDQDDVWLPHKIEITLNKMLAMELECGKAVPILVHTDLQVVDSNLKLLDASYWNYRKIDPSRDRLNYLLSQNIVTGCAMMINSALREKVKYIPQEALMHDWWLALIAAVFGRIFHISEATICYRQHGKNTLGAKQWSLGHWVELLFKYSEVKGRMLKAEQQAKAFLELYQADNISYGDKKILDTYANLRKFNYFYRRYLIFKYKYFKAGFIRNLVMFFLC